MRILLDTNALLWLLSDDTRLSPSARSIIEGASEILVSEVSLWEISIKISIGKLQAIPTLHNIVRDLGFRRLNMQDKHLLGYESLPLIHRDPFDRMLVAQALSEDVSLLTSDTMLGDYGVKIIAT
ncbi:MAG: type II toxin-antitoxin system VapC family toxin [Candidatus Saccharimonadales bacterium]